MDSPKYQENYLETRDSPRMDAANPWRAKPTTLELDEEQGQKDSQKKFNVLRYMFETTVFHGPGKIYAAPSKLIKVFWVMVLLGAIAATIYQLVNLFGTFFSYPVKTEVKLGFSPLALPSVTLCNINPVRLSKVTDLSCELQKLFKIDAASASTKCNISIENDIDYDDYDEFDFLEDFFGCWGELCDSQEDMTTYHIRRLLINWNLADESSAVRIEAGHQLKDMLLDCTVLGYSCTEENFTRFLSKDYGNCYTFSAPDIKATRSGPDSGLQLTLNLETEEFITSYKTGYGLRVVLHEQGTRAFPSSEGYTLSSGSEINIGLRMVDINRKGGLYGSCMNGDEVKKATSYKYTIASCRDWCHYSRVIQKCGCAPFEDDLHGDARNDSSYGTTKYCISKEEVKCQGDFFEDYFDDAEGGEGDSCSCNMPCHEMRYVSTMSSRAWPIMSYMKILEQQACQQSNSSPKCNYSSQELTLDDLDLRRSSFVRLNIYYDELNFEKVTEEPFYDPERFLSDIGGTLGLWIGASVLGVFEVFEFLFLLAARLRHRL